jgi:hypothetical protein
MPAAQHVVKLPPTNTKNPPDSRLYLVRETGSFNGELDEGQPRRCLWGLLPLQPTAGRTELHPLTSLGRAVL